MMSVGVGREEGIVVVIRVFGDATVSSLAALRVRSIDADVVRKLR